MYSCNVSSCPRISSPCTKVRICNIHHNEDQFHFAGVRQSLKGKIPDRCRWSFINCKETSSENSYKQDRPDVSQATLIWRAIKLPIYSVAIIPLTVASASAYFQSGNFSLRRYLGLLVSSIFIITWLNLSNDVYDFDTGADKNKQESVVNMIGSRTGTLVAANLLLGFGFLGLILVALEAGNVRSILLLLCAVLCGYVYQCPPFRLSYKGLGEPLCFAAFGPFATTAFFLMQITSRKLFYQHPLTNTILSASVLVGCTTTLILFCCHFHQVEGDREVGKLSPLVMSISKEFIFGQAIGPVLSHKSFGIQVQIGREAGSKIVKIAVIVLYSTLLIYGIRKALPLPSIVLCALTIPMGIAVITFVEKNYSDDRKIFMAKYYCVRLHALFGMALAAGLVVAMRLGKHHSIPLFA